MITKNTIDNLTSFIMDPSNNAREPLTQGIAWTTTIILGFGTIGIIQGLSALWRKLRHIDQNDTHEKISRLFQKIFSRNSANETFERTPNTHTATTLGSESLRSASEPRLIHEPVEMMHIQKIDPEFTEVKSIIEQREAHKNAKKYMQQEAERIGAEVFFVLPGKLSSCPKVDDVEIKHLDAKVFTWQNTNGVQGDIQADGKNSDHVVLYGVASQFNSCEAVSRFTPEPGTAVETYRTDPTQGPGAQLQFPDEQVEIINHAANLGFNGLCEVLDDSTKNAVKHGYLTPKTEKSASIVIEQLKANGHKMEFPCIGNIPKGANTEKVYEILVAAPAFGIYSLGKITDQKKKKIEFLCALQSYRAQFQQALKLAALHPQKQLIFKPTAPGLGVFGNRVDNVAKAFYVAAKEYESRLIDKKIQVRLQVFQSRGSARMMANTLRLTQWIEGV
ncbi:hypothetical protein [Waddlia chondrophila]|uniref:Uncharacterized protein n=2 Tax=Waddlia chondrophila TaxID=71667 RepID=D6YS42_WADCW|nr:hypothetical protein [Waddlia chondrophila]ADI38887.1 hypothetical protein wcw_1538 [Waddlia chondrophila WSU 86-1044]